MLAPLHLPSTETAGAPGTGLVLVVDRDPVMRESLGALLEAYGFEVRSFADGQAFLAEAGLSWRACVLLDVDMRGGPDGGSGAEILSAFRRRHLDLPVILMTGGVPGASGDATAWLRKPIRPDDLLGQICSAFRACP